LRGVEESRGAVVALGNFDGVHLGHQAVIRRALEIGRDSGRRVIAATFDPHPRAVIRPGTEPWLLTTPEKRRELLLGCGADEVYVIPFDAALSQKSPEEFVEDVLVGEIGASAVVVGESFRFGHKASGGVGELDRSLRKSGGEAYPVPIHGQEEAGGDEISSSRIREFISEGDVAGAERLLGRPYTVHGEVVTGDQRGATIGFPTANLKPDPRILVPARGVYAGYALTSTGGRHGACTNVGTAPTFERQENRIEAHLLDFDGDLYGEMIEVGFTERLRGEQKFSGIEELKAQISRDVQRTRALEGGAP
jgi:riboflavin kinase/FMN adenylyltransferase